MGNSTNPRVFIASSVESLSIANSVNVNLDHYAEVTVWKDGFTVSTNTIDGLIKYANSVDFAIFIFTPDDISEIREKSTPVARDNVLYELGLFTGSLGKERCFIIKPRDEELHFPTDLLGLTPTDYESNRSDKNLISAVNAPCTLILNRIDELGALNHISSINNSFKKEVNVDSNFSAIHYCILGAILREELANINGMSVSILFGELKRNFQDIQLSTAVLKLERSGYVERFITEDFQYGEYYALKLTSDGKDLLLKNEKKLTEFLEINSDVQNDESIPF